MGFIPVEKSVLKTLRSEIKKFLKVSDENWKICRFLKDEAYVILGCYRFLCLHHILHGCASCKKYDWYLKVEEEVQKAAAGFTLPQTAYTSPQGVSPLSCLKKESDESIPREGDIYLSKADEDKSFSLFHEENKGKKKGK